MSSRTQKILSVLLAAVMFAGAVRFTQPLNSMRRELNLVRMAIEKQARPDLLTNVLLSVGRALAVDYLWIGLQNLQQKKRFFDAQQRAEWICQLQPHFPSVWIFQSWNLSYNISVMMTTGKDRWRWVRGGYELLRDRAIPLNPNSLKLYQQLAWIFHHKIGAMTDDQHWYYKVQIAKDMERIIGWPDPDYDAMAEAPRTWEAVLEIDGMNEFVSRLQQLGFDAQSQYMGLIKNIDQQPEKVRDLLVDPAYEEDRRLLEGHLRAKMLMDEWKLDARTIAELRTEDMFGPLDFRTAQAHAIYWAYTGLKRVGQDVSFDALSNQRVIYGSLQDLVRMGRIYVTDEEVPLVTPDIRFIPIVERTYLAISKVRAEAEGRKWDGKAGETLKSGYINFLRKAIALLYQFGSEKLARHYWEKMTTNYPLPEYNVGMKKYIFQYVLEDMASMGFKDANATVTFFLWQSFQRYAAGDDYAAVGMEKLAKTIYDMYMENKQWRQQTGRTLMASYDTIKKRVLQDVLTTYKKSAPDLYKRLRDRLESEGAEVPEIEEKAPGPAL